MKIVNLDAAKRKALPVWIREGLEKMEREKQKKAEKEAKKRQQEEEKAAKEQAEKEAEEELERDNNGEPRVPRKSRFVSRVSKIHTVNQFIFACDLFSRKKNL